MPEPRPPSDMVLLRYQIISAYLAMDPPRGQRGALLRALAARSWALPDGREVRFAAETLRGWVRKFRKGGLSALHGAPRPTPGVQIVDAAVQEMLCRLKRDVPARSVERVIEVAEETGLVPVGLLKRSTVHRVLRAKGLSSRKKAEASTADLDRFEAAHPNDLWQSDMMCGPYLPDPDRPGKHRRAWLHAWLDDHSRLLLAGRWSFKSDLPTLELTFREALRRHGIPKRVYYDNGGPYRSDHMKQIVAVLSNDRPIYTPPRRPEGHGKIEAFNRLCRAAFVEEVKASSIQTLDALNRAFRAWVDLKYNRRVHGETGQAPWDRWRAGAARMVIVGERTLTEAFLFRAQRTTDKTGVFKLLGGRFQTGPELARKKIEVRYDPDDMATIEVWLKGVFRERVQPLNVEPSRRGKPAAKTGEAPSAPADAAVDYLASLVDRHTPLPTEDLVAAAHKEQAEHIVAVTAIFTEHLAPEVVAMGEVRAFVERYGPLDLEAVEAHLVEAVDVLGKDPHIHTVLADLRAALSVVEA